MKIEQLELTPVISMYGPWANWVSLGWKTIETRLHARFSSLAGKTIGIHVSKKWDDTALDAAREWLSYEQRCLTKDFLKIGGAIICTARVLGVDWLTAKDSQRALIDCASVRRFGLFLSDVQIIPMIACKGKQGIWYHDLRMVKP